MRNQSLNRSARMLLNGGCSVGAVAAMGLLLSPGAALAQDANGGLEEIVVTAQKKEESLQDVPVAVTAVAAAQIENLQIRSLNSLSGLAPNVTTTSSVSGSDPTITIRGIIGANATNGTDSAVAMYIDGVYLARTTGASFEVADIERVEVLRGPQGTLYGRSSTGGAVNFITSGPKGEFYARLEGTVGNLDRRRVKVRVDTPTFGGFSFTAAYLHDEQSGWVRNLDGGLAWNFGAANRFLPGTRTSVPSLGAYNSEAGFFAAHYESESGAVKVDYKFDITSSDRANQAQQVLFDGTGGLLVPPALTSLSRLDAVSMPMTTPEQLRTFGHSLTVQAEIGEGLTVKSITGYRGAEDGYTNDVSGSGGAIPNFGTFGMTNIVAYEETRGFQQEVQLNYISKVVDVLGGINYFHERTTSTAPVYIFQAVPFTVPDRSTLLPTVDGDGTANNESIAAFAQVTLHVSDRLDVTGGIRHTKDNRAVDERGSFHLDFDGDGVQETNIIRTDSEANFAKTDWTANITFRPTDDITLYAKAGSGYLAGGAFSGIPFQPETVVQYEAGAKADLFDRRVRVNLAAFHTDYKGLQQANFYPVPNTNTIAYYVKNVANAKIDGVEVEVAVVPVEGLTLSGFYGYNNFRYVTPGQGNPSYRPKHNAALNLNYKLPEFGDGIKPIIDVNARYTGKQFYVPSTGYTGALAAALQDNAALIVDARVTLADIPLAGSRARLSAWSKNLFDNRKLANATDATGGTVVNGQFRQPRTYGLDVGFEF